MFNYRWRLLELSALRLLSASVLMRQRTLAFERIGKARIVRVGSALIDIDRLPGLPFRAKWLTGRPPTASRCIAPAGSSTITLHRGTNMYIAGGS
jgi:hypothetical protein